MTQEELAKDIHEQFDASEPLAEAFNNLFVALQPSPLTICFAALIADKFLAAQIKDWVEIRNWAIQAFRGLEKSGALPQCEPDGSVTNQDGINSRGTHPTRN